MATLLPKVDMGVGLALLWGGILDDAQAFAKPLPC